MQQNSNIVWARVWNHPSSLITKTLKYTMNSFELIIHNATVDDIGYYACYANDTYTVYKVVHVNAIECKCSTHPLKL